MKTNKTIKLISSLLIFLIIFSLTISLSTGCERAAGETAPIMFTVAAFSQPNLPNSIFSQVMVLPFNLYSLATQVTNPPEEKQWGTVLVLLMVVLSFAIIGISLRTRARLRRKE